MLQEVWIIEFLEFFFIIKNVLILRIFLDQIFGVTYTGAASPQE